MYNCSVFKDQTWIQIHITFQIDSDETVEIDSDLDPKYGSVTLDTIRHNCIFTMCIRIKAGSRSILHSQIDPDETVELDPDPDPMQINLDLLHLI